MWHQQTISLRARSRGFHLITDEIEAALPELRHVQRGLLHLLLQHTSASLTLNENTDPDVRADFETFFHRLAPENAPGYRHTLEGPDDLPAHFKSSLLGVSVTLPVKNGRLALGTWQGLFLGEHRQHGGQRRIVATLQGEAR
ncbi:secondary thiamine-phosphate synthase enzyme YjbQ [Halomonas sp. CSM-2]|uniref:secondary thiamine-phosphate synthase enzyme YjbQ n=1 Tax=Halomonas sp. CSM-2 TaxID=1975722 RepID=UPI000A27FF50|nr:secondary thiamine-phosphate synthase enzyme YjbQ [Halomonas sp. CSM-2]